MSDIAEKYPVAPRVKKVEAKEKSLANLHKRMDEDFERWDLQKIIYDKHPTAINITTNDPRTFADDVHQRLSGAEMQIIVRMAEKKGEDKREDIGKLERLFHFALEKGDELLARKLMPPLRESVVWFGNIRGWRAGRFLVYQDNGNVIFDLLPWDPRWVTYEVGANGLIWANHKMFRSRDALEDEYNFDAPAKAWYTPWVKDKKTVEVLDWWEIPDRNEPTEILNGLICGGQWVKDPVIYNLPSMPISIRPVAVRPPISGGATTTSDIMAEGYGESIYGPLRDTYDILNRLYSIEATRANLLSKQPLINYYKQGGVINLKDTIMQAEGILNLPDDYNRLEPVPMKEIPVTLLNMIEKLDAKRERAEVPHIEIGKPPPSGTLFGLVQEAGDKVFVPQLRNLNLFYSDICRLIEEQLVAGKLKVEVEGEAKRKYFATKVAPVDLKRAHIIKVEFSSRTAWQDLEAAQQADMLKRLGLPDEFIWEYILKLPDPKGLTDQVALEIAEHSPTLMRLRAIKTLLAQGRNDEAKALIEELFLERLQQQQMEGQAEQPIEAEPTGEVASV